MNEAWVRASIKPTFNKPTPNRAVDSSPLDINLANGSNLPATKTNAQDAFHPSSPSDSLFMGSLALKNLTPLKSGGGSPFDPPVTPPDPPPPSITDGQKQAAGALRFLISNPALYNTLVKAGPADDAPAITVEGVQKLAAVPVDDESFWGTIPKSMRADAQGAALSLMGANGKKDTAAAFNGALQAHGDKNSMSLEEAQVFIEDPSKFTPVNGPFLPNIIELAPGVIIKTKGMTPSQIQNAIENLEVVPGVIVKTKGMTPAQIQNIYQDIQFMASDVDGSKLIKKATEDGPITIAYESSFNGGPNMQGKGGDYKQNQIRLSGGTLNSKEGISILAHEFTHAATDNSNKNSKTEEALGTVLGSRIRNRYTGAPVNEQALYDGWIDMALEPNSTYGDLPFDNHIFEDLAALGIIFNINKRTPPE